MFKELFTEAKRGTTSRFGAKASTAAKITDIVKVIKGMDPLDVMGHYEALRDGYLSEKVYENFVQQGDYDYYDDREKKGLIKKVLVNLKKAMDKEGIDYNVVDCSNNYLKDKDNYIADRVVEKTWEGYKGKDLGYKEIKDYSDAITFCEKFKVAERCIIAMKKLLPKTVCEFNNAGLTKITYKEVKHKQGLNGHTTSFTEEFEVTVYHYQMKETVKFNVSKTETTVHQSYWN